MSYEHCDKHDREKTNGCPGCIEDRLIENYPGWEWQIDQDTGREGVRCGCCQSEVGKGLVFDGENDRGLCEACAYRVWSYITARREIERA